METSGPPDAAGSSHSPLPPQFARVKMASAEMEPFPPLQKQFSKQNVARKEGGLRRRKSSTLGAELPGDNDVAAFATLGKGSPPASPTEPTRDKSVRRSKRRTIRRAFSRGKRLCFRHTWLLPLIATLTIISLYLVNPTESNPISAALFLSYPLPREPGSDPDAPTMYGKGARDFAFVGFYIIVLSFTREFLMQRLIRPIALRYGIKSRAKQSRFMEQFYTAVYFAIYGPFGLWVMSRTPVWYFNTTGMYEGFPHKIHDGYFKAYYLLQASYWAQQMVVLLLMLEAPRKDFKELVAHHFITLALIWCSYRFHFTYMGLAVYITHDISDFFLATSKVLNYIDSDFTGPYFFVFMCAWGYLRHYINLKILYSVLTEFTTVGPYELNWETQQYKCWIAQYITFGLLASLQAVNLFWWFLICRIAYRFVTKSGLEDDRSEYEDSDAEVEGKDKMEGKDKKEKKAAKANGKPGMNGTANGTANGTPNGAPRVLINGQTPETPDRTTTATESGSIGSRVRARKGQN